MLAEFAEGACASGARECGDALGTMTGGHTVLLYHWYELGRAAFRPARAAADSCRLFFNPLNPLTHTPMGRSAVAACEVFERATRRYSKPDFGIARTRVDGRSGGASPRRSCGRRRSAASSTSSATSIRRAPARHPRLLLVAPMSGHFATLLRGTVETFLPDHEVYITDWQDARNVPLSAGQLRSRRLHRHHGRHVPLLRRRRARVRRVPAVRAGAGRHRADGGGRRPRRAARR